ncbi:hypothetical protein D3C79_799530 [compost metagenome]
MGLAAEVEEQRPDPLVIAVMKQADFGVLGDPVAYAQAPLAAVAGFDVTGVSDGGEGIVRQAVDHPGTEAKELGARSEGIAAEIIAHRVELSLFPLVLIEADQRQVFIERPRGRHLPHRQVGVLGFSAGHVELGRIHRRLTLTDVGPEQTLAPGHQVAPSLDRQVLTLGDIKVAVDIGIEQSGLAAAQAAGVFRKTIGAADLVDGVR